MPDVIDAPGVTPSGAGGGGESAESVDEVRAAIAAELALVERVAPTRREPFGYGTDLRCASDLTRTHDTVDPFSPVAIAEALARRLETPRGSVPDAPDDGLDLRAYLNQGTAATEIRTLADRIRTECRKDDRVAALRVVVSPSPNGSELDVALRVQPVDPRTGSFSLTLAVSSAAVLLKELRAA